MGKAKTQKRSSATSSPYDRPSKQNAAVNNVFKFNTKDYGQRKGYPALPVCFGQLGLGLGLGR